MSGLSRPVIGIRADASPVLGMGHIMRCISIAQSLGEAGAECVFLCANDYPAEAVRSFGFGIQVLHSDCYHLEDETPQVQNAVEQFGLSGLLIDSYYATDRYLLRLQQDLPVVYIDGLYRCRADIAGVINYNAAADRSEYETRFAGTHALLMVGLDYTPLRKEFRGEKKEKRISDRIGSILITTGATDNYGVMEALCRHWKETSAFEGIRKDIILGKMFREPERLAREFSDDPSFVFTVNPKDMRDHMEQADLAISAAGTTVYELLSMRVPSVIFSLADIQNTVEILAPSIAWAGDIRDNSRKELLSDDAAVRITEIAVRLADHPEERRAMSVLAGSRIDGKGSERLARGILEAIKQ